MDSGGGEAQDLGGGFSEASLAKIKLANTHSPEPGSSPLVSASSPPLSSEGASAKNADIPQEGAGYSGGTSDWARVDSASSDVPLRSRPRSAMRRGGDDLRIQSISGGVKFGEGRGTPDSPILPSPQTTSPIPWHKAPIKPQLRKMEAAPMSPLGGVVPLKAGVGGGEAKHLGEQWGAERAARSLSSIAQDNMDRPLRGTSPIIQRRRALHQVGSEDGDLIPREQNQEERGVPLDRQPDTETLLDTVLLSCLSPQDKRELLGRVRFHFCAAGFNVVEEGEPGASLFIVAEGTCQGVKDGKETLEYPPGSFFGEVSLVQAVEAGKIKTEVNMFATFGEEGEEEEMVGLRTASVRTKTDCAIYEIDATDAARILKPSQEAWGTLQRLATTTSGQSF